MPSEKSLLSSLTDSLRKELPQFVVIKHADMWTVGIPDLSVTGNLDTSWYETKFAKDGPFKSTGIQDLTMLRLANQSHHARYIIYESRKRLKETFIVHPNNLQNWATQFEFRFEGFNHDAVVNYIKKVHNIV